MPDLDRRLAALGQVEADHDLEGLEDAVWAEIDGRARLRPLPRRLAVATGAAVAMIVSAAGASIAATSAGVRDVGPFSVEAPLAPSTILNN